MYLARDPTLTASSTSTGVNQPILPCQRLGCMQGYSLLQWATLGTHLLAEYYYVVVERFLSAPRVFLVLKRSFTVSLSSLDVLLILVVCCLVLFGLFPVFVLLLDIQHTYHMLMANFTKSNRLSILVAKFNFRFF